MALSAADPASVYETLKYLGQGSFAKVYLAKHRKTKTLVAIKIIDLEQAEDEIEEIQAEVKTLASMSCPSITKYLASYLKRSELYIVMEYLGGGSMEKLLKGGSIPETQLSSILYNLLKALEYIHERCRIHRDVKASNILLSEAGEVKLADFGVSAELSGRLDKRFTFVGSPYWMAPEIVQQKGYSYGVDVWSLGITAIQLATSEVPLSNLAPMKALFIIPNDPPPRLGEPYSRNLQEFVALCLIKNPTERATIQQLLRTRFIKSRKAKPSDLVSIIERYRGWREGRDSSSSSELDADPKFVSSEEEMEAWDFSLSDTTSDSPDDFSRRSTKSSRKKKPRRDKSSNRERKRGARSDRPKRSRDSPDEVIKNRRNTSTSVSLNGRERRKSLDLSVSKKEKVPDEHRRRNTIDDEPPRTPSQSMKISVSSSSTKLFSIFSAKNNKICHSRTKKLRRNKKRRSKKPPPKKSAQSDEVKSKSEILSSLIYPALSKLLDDNDDEATIRAAESFKEVFDTFEKGHPGKLYDVIVQILTVIKQHKKGQAQTKKKLTFLPQSGRSYSVDDSVVGRYIWQRWRKPLRTNKPLKGLSSKKKEKRKSMTS